MKITRTENTINVKAGATALAKMGGGFLAYTSLAAWISGSLGCFNLLFAAALEQAFDLGVNSLTYGVIEFDIIAHNGNGVCTTATLKAHALDCYGFEQAATLKVTLDHNNGNTAKKCSIYKPATKTERNIPIKKIDGLAIHFTGVGFDLIG